MAKKKKKVELSSEGKTELAKAIAKISKLCENVCAHRNFSQPFLSLVKRLVGSFVV